MKVKEKKIDDLNLQLTFEVEAADYAEIERKKLAEIRRTAEFKGFRKGKVPTSMIQHVYGSQVLVDSVNQVLGEAMDKHIKDKKLRTLGEPLSSEKQPEVEWTDGNNFTFIFDLGLSPEFDVEVEATDTVPSYSVTLSAKDKAPLLENLKKFYEEKKEEKSDAELDKEVTERMRAENKNEADWRLSKDIRKFYIEKSGLRLPEDFLKRWLLKANEGTLKPEDVDRDFPGFADDLKWQLVRGYFMNKFGFKVDENDLREQALNLARYQFAMYGMNDVAEEMLQDMALRMLQDQRQVDRLIEQAEDQKVMGKIKETITLKPTKISMTKFSELR